MGLLSLNQNQLREKKKYIPENPISTYRKCLIPVLLIPKNSSKSLWKNYIQTTLAELS